MSMYDIDYTVSYTIYHDDGEAWWMEDCECFGDVKDVGMYEMGEVEAVEFSPNWDGYFPSWERFIAREFGVRKGCGGEYHIPYEGNDQEFISMLQVARLPQKYPVVAENFSRLIREGFNERFAFVMASFIKQGVDGWSIRRPDSDHEWLNGNSANMGRLRRFVRRGQAGLGVVSRYETNMLGRQCNSDDLDSSIRNCNLYFGRYRYKSWVSQILDCNVPRHKRTILADLVESIPQDQWASELWPLIKSRANGHCAYSELDDNDGVATVAYSLDYDELLNRLRMMQAWCMGDCNE